MGSPMFLRSIHHHFLGVPNLEYLYGDWPNTMLKTPLPLHGMEDHKPDITFFEHTCEQCSNDVILKILIFFTPLYPMDPHFCDDSALFFSFLPSGVITHGLLENSPYKISQWQRHRHGGFKPSAGGIWGYIHIREWRWRLTWRCGAKS